jgi:Protein of unknown function (DUF1670)
MSGEAYVGTAKRRFTAALFHLLEQEYGILGSRRILEMLAQDVQALVEQFYPNPERIGSGWMVFTGTKASGKKARIGQSADDHELVTLAWPVLVEEDLKGLTEGVTERRTHPQRPPWYQKRLMRIVEYGWQHPAGPVLLTLADLCAMLGISTSEASVWLQQVRTETDKKLPTKGEYFDQGMRPTHKEEILTLYEAGVDEADIARRTQHAQDSVGNYIRGYERVRLMLQKQVALEHIAALLDLQPSVVRAYVELLKRFHPDMFSAVPPE